jgi:hypothetical protein
MKGHTADSTLIMLYSVIKLAAFFVFMLCDFFLISLA